MTGIERMETAGQEGRFSGLTGYARLCSSLLTADTLEGVGKHAHHVFPVAFTNDFLKRFGVRVNDARYGAWWDAEAHLKNAYKYNQDWRRWLDEHKATLHDLAAQFGVSAERIRQLEQAAINRLRNAMST